jgi:hypothetical protein
MCRLKVYLVCRVRLPFQKTKHEYWDYCLLEFVSAMMVMQFMKLAATDQLKQLDYLLLKNKGDFNFPLSLNLYVF